MVQQYGIKRYNLARGRYERSPFAEVEKVRKGDLEISLSKILDSAKSAASMPPSFTMIVWNGYGEFQAIA
jgi:hypothetical protein